MGSIAHTGPFTFGFHEVANAVVLLIEAMRLRACPPIDV